MMSPGIALLRWRLRRLNEKSKRNEERCRAIVREGLLLAHDPWSLARRLMQNGGELLRRVVKEEAADLL